MDGQHPGLRGLSGPGRARRAAAAVLLAAACLAGCTAAAPPAPALRVLQLNLCGSGIAGCYTGRSTAEAAAVVRAERPDVLTLNEVCRDDVAALERALADAVPEATVISAFQPARDARTGQPYRCRAGGDYGIGLVTGLPAVPGSAAGGIHPDQDPQDPEQRAWLCLDTAAPPVTVCTTHPAYTVLEVAVAQCRHLFGPVLAGRRERGPAAQVVGADLNLGPSDGAALRSCVPPGSVLADDGGRQHVVATPDLAVVDVRTPDLRGSTDHPGLLVGLSPA